MKFAGNLSFCIAKCLVRELLCSLGNLLYGLLVVHLSVIFIRKLEVSANQMLVAHWSGHPVMFVGKHHNYFGQPKLQVLAVHQLISPMMSTMILANQVLVPHQSGEPNDFH